MKALYLIENNTPVVAMVTMEKPKSEYFGTSFKLPDEGYRSFRNALNEYDKHLATAQRYPVGDVPKEWRVGDQVDVQLWYQRYGYATWWEYDISCIMNSEKISIVARPVGEGCTCDMCEFIVAEKAMEELGVKQETEAWEALLLAVDDLAIDYDNNYYGLPHDKFSEFTEKLKDKGFTITRKTNTHDRE